MFEADSGGGPGIVSLPPQELYDEFVQLLGGNVGDVEGLKQLIFAVPASNFGASDAAAQLGAASRAAHEAQLNELSNIVVGLNGLISAMNGYKDNLEDADANAKQALQALASFVDAQTYANLTNHVTWGVRAV